MVPATKKRKLDPEPKYLCTSCSSERLSTQFPDYNPSPDCEHTIHTCKICLKKWVQAKVDEGTFKTGGEVGEVFGVECPECPSIMRSVNIEIAATKAVHAKFEVIERKHIADTTPGWRWCLSPFCSAGKVHEKETVKITRFKKRLSDSDEDPIADIEERSNICTCQNCGARACVDCDRPWHAGETCVDYQARIRDRVDEENKALEEIERNTKACPNPACRTRIQKNGGCSAVYCTACRRSFCWICEEIFGAQEFCRCIRRIRGEHD